jgi:hypothetical protein
LACWLGKVKKIKGAELKIDYLNPKGIWSSSMPTYKLGNIRTIEFDTDYVNSLKLIAKKSDNRDELPTQCTYAIELFRRD